jgi:hypothetical protein
MRNYTPEIEDIEPGQTIRVNHTDCPAGEDTRRRLYISRPHANPMLALAYCHNCQEKGVQRTETYESYRTAKHHNSVVTHKIVEENVVQPEGMVFEYYDWPMSAQAWAIKSRISGALISKYRIAYDPSSNRVYLPRYTYYTHGVPARLDGYQLRNIEKNKEPKYYTVSRSNSKGFTTIRTDGWKLSSYDTVIVEDLVSGMHVVEALGKLSVEVVVNYGVKVNLEALYSMKGAEHAFVWLDNDNDHVIAQAKTMGKTLDLLSSDIKVEVIWELYHDPKHYTQAACPSGTHTTS